MRYLNRIYQTTGVEVALISAAVAGAAGTVYSGVQQKKAAKVNAQIATNEATYQAQKGEAEEKRHLANMKKAAGEGRVAAATSGVSLLSGSVQDVFDENTEEGLYDAVMIRHGAKMASDSATAQASMFMHQGNTALTSGFIKAGSSLLAQGASIAE